MQSIYIEDSEVKKREQFTKVCEKVRDHTVSVSAVTIHSHCN